MKYLLLLLMLCVGCDIITPTIKVDEDKAKADAALTVSLVPLSKDTSPDIQPDKPVSGKCDNCEGSGKVSDHNGAFAICPVCKGTGKSITFSSVEKNSETLESPKALEIPEIKAEPEKVLVKHTLYFYHLESCGPCKEWDYQDRPKFEAAGINVIDAEFPASGKININGTIVEIRNVPFYVAYYNNNTKVVWFRGKLSLEKFLENVPKD